jgi:hypothetical protein
MNPKATLRSVALIMLVLVVVAGLFVFGPTVGRKLLGPAPAGVKQLNNIDQLQADFNRDDGSTRLVMIFSPT